ncbi:MAG: MFS transporter [Methanobrevibacter sp.]|uniref:MFS transporter n=1 Tax=Methanobrevibacter sp. TaxID=66852 RepID=UPI001B1A5095|nr:MFS transporter [Methanobrevibacter sp.]MBO6111240.1 MFS transporter [Methanobrevibacter sp.]MBP3792360.1 MFS transporter [Methanobrevibacter sp.]
MKYNPKVLLYILMLSTMGINTPLSIIGIISQISEYFNTSIAISGLYVSSFTFTIAVTGLFIPIFFSKYEIKKTFITILGIFAISNILIIFTHSIYIATFFRVLSAVFYPAFISIALTFCEKIAPAGQEQDYITKILLGISIGSIVGLPITTGFGTIFGYQVAMSWIFLFNLITLILIIIFFPSIPGKSKSYEMPLSSIKSKEFILATLGIIMMPIGASIVYNYLPYFLQTVSHVYTYKLSVFLFAYGVVSIFGTWLGGKLIYKKDKATLIVFQLVCAAVFLGIYLLSDNLLPVLILILIFGILDGMGYNLIQYIETSVLPESPELANGIFLSVLNGGIALGIAIGGFLVDGFGVMSIFTSGIVFLLLAFLLLVYVIFILKIPLKY